MMTFGRFAKAWHIAHRKPACPVLFSARKSKRTFAQLLLVLDHYNLLEHKDLPKGFLRPYAGGDAVFLTVTNEECSTPVQPWVPQVFEALILRDRGRLPDLANAPVLIGYDETPKKKSVHLLDSVALAFRDDDEPYFHCVLGTKL